MDRDTITRTGARAPGVERQDRSNGGVTAAPRTSTQSEDHSWSQGDTKDGCKPSGVMHATSGKAVWSKNPYGRKSCNFNGVEQAQKSPLVGHGGALQTILDLRRGGSGSGRPDPSRPAARNVRSAPPISKMRISRRSADGMGKAQRRDGGGHNRISPESLENYNSPHTDVGFVLSQASLARNSTRRVPFMSEPQA